MLKRVVNEAAVNSAEEITAITALPRLRDDSFPSFRGVARLSDVDAGTLFKEDAAHLSRNYQTLWTLAVL